MSLARRCSGSYRKVEVGAANKNLQTEQLHRRTREVLTVDHKDIRTSVRQTRNVQEVDVILRDGHYWLVICGKG